MAALGASRFRPLLPSAWRPLCSSRVSFSAWSCPSRATLITERRLPSSRWGSLLKQQRWMQTSPCNLSHLWNRAASACGLSTHPARAASGVYRLQTCDTSTLAESAVNGEREIIRAGSSKADPYEYSRRFVKDEYRVPVGLWLLACTGWVAGLVVWGGLTRLTESGLSMTRWKFIGSKWPGSHEEWMEEFEAYKQTPEYLQLNHGMSLSEYKRIYFFEWAHRWLGRAAGILFFIGAGACAVARCVKKPLGIRLAVYGALGGFQGLVGWWMVRSGLKEPTTEVKTPRVSPYRLAFHLVTATCLYTLLLWQSLSLLLPSPPKAALAAAAAAAATTAKQAHAFAALAGITFVSGAFVAGNDAGRCCNTWPKMLDNWVPPELYAKPLTWRRFFENPPTVQFDHRCLAYLTLLSSFLLYSANKTKPFPPPVKAALRFLPLITSVQLLLGITTVLMYVPTELGVLHQAGGLLTLSGAVYLMHLLSRFKLRA